MDIKENILKNALSLFSSKGYDSVGIVELCESSNISKPTLYYHFTNKEGVLNALLNHYYTKLNERIMVLSSYCADPSSYFEDVYPVLLSVAKGYFVFSKENPEFYQLVFQATFGARKSLIRSVAEPLNLQQYDILEKMFKKMSKAHPNMLGKERAFSRTLLGMINTYIAMNETTETAAMSAIKQFMHGIYS